MADTHIVETSEISRILSGGVVVTLPDGTQGFVVALVINPAAGKSYPDGETAFPAQIRLGMQLYQVEPLNLTFPPEPAQPDDESLAALHDADPSASATQPPQEV